MASFSINLFFETIWERDIPEIRSRATLYRHKKTKAEVLVLDNDDENKLFGIGFTTLPADSTGIAHILEHSVLNGSRKYPVKEPFVELIKTSLNTFLNAMTWPDKTIYPVASQNEEDLHNLMDVYLDAVFFPRISPDILKQEGWHYELKNREDPLIIKGVVFNEMKGANSNPDSLTEKYMNQALFPDTLYSLDSGGEPDDIPTLTYEAFKKFHETYYHPSNSKTLLYGKQDFTRSLEHLHEYLEQFDYLSIEAQVAVQQPFNEPVIFEKKYPVSAEGDLSKKAIAVNGWVLGDSIPPLDRMGLEILDYILLGSEASPLKKALLESGLGEDIAGWGSDMEYRQPVFFTGLKGIKHDDAPKVDEIIQTTLEQLTKGINAELVTGAINRIDFTRREATPVGKYPKNVTYFRRMLTTWNYGFDPITPLQFRESIDEISLRVRSGEHFFEDLIKKYLLGNNHRAYIRLVPDAEFTTQKENAERARLAEYKKSLTQSEIDSLISETERLEEWQKKTDTEEDLQKLPMLKISDVKPEVVDIPTEEVEIGSTKILKHGIETNGITYLDFGFNLNTLTPQELSVVGFYATLLVKLGTKNRDYEKLSIALDQNTGGLQTTILSTPRTEAPNVVNSYLFFNIKMLSEQVAEGIELLQDILLNTDFDQKERVRQLLLEEKAQMEPAIVASGHLYSMNRALSGLNLSHSIKEATGGITYYERLKELTEQIEKDWSAVIGVLRGIHAKLINRNALLVNITAPDVEFARIDSALVPMIDTLPNGTSTEATISFTAKPIREAFTIPSPVNYVSEAYDIRTFGFTPHGSLYTIGQHLYTAYLWNRVRVQGGAYGGMFRFDQRSGTFGFMSYRDPNIENTFGIYREAAEYLRSLKLSSRELEGSILGAVGKVDAYLTPYEKGWQGMEWHLGGLTKEIRQERKDQLLLTSSMDFLRFSEILAGIPDEAKSRVVLGNKEKINETEKKLGLEVKELL